MGTVGINFGPINSGQGFDVASTVSAIMAAEQAIEDPWKTQLSSLQAQDTAFSKIGTDMSALATALQKLTDFTGVLAGKQGSSSNENAVVISSATSTASAGSHTIVVNSLAQTSTQYSDQVTNSADTLSGTIQISINGASSQKIDVSKMTLSQIAAQINGAGMGVQASVVTDTHGSRISIVSNTSGAEGEISMSGSSLSDDANGGAVNFNESTAGKDADLIVDGLEMTSASNTVTGAIPGITLQLLSKTDPSNPVQIQIVTDNNSIESAMSDFVNAYNAVVDDVQAEEGKDTNGNPMPLYGDPTLALIQSSLAQGLLSGSASGSIKDMSQLGLSIDKTGHLSLNGDTLDATLNKSFSDVQGFLQNPDSFGQKFNTILNNLGSTSTTGAITLALQQNANQETSLNQSISDQDARIANDKANLTAELNTANQILQSLPSQLNQIDQLYSAITGYKQQS
jgi:flagellar hook-associated protein 2